MRNNVKETKDTEDERMDGEYSYQCHRWTCPHCGDINDGNVCEYCGCPYVDLD